MIVERLRNILVWSNFHAKILRVSRNVQLGSLLQKPCPFLAIGENVVEEEFRQMWHFCTLFELKL